MVDSLSSVVPVEGRINHTGETMTLPIYIERAKHSQPDYSNLLSKIAAREENVAIYRRLTGNYSIPSDRGYWTLCDEQPNEPGSEVVQLCSLGLISKSQFFGVDWDKDKIAKNKVVHPEANWYYGEWREVIREQDNFNPALVYLDTTSFADHLPSAKLIASTMYLCSANTVVLFNVMLNDPRSKAKFDPTGQMRLLQRFVGPLELRKWVQEIENYTYSGTGKTNMITYVLYKKED